MAKVADRVAGLLRRPRRITLEEYTEKLIAKGLKADGTMDVDPTPLAPPVGYKKSPSMVEIVRDMVRSERLAMAAREAGHETFEESEDFDVGDDPELLRSPWENDFDPPLVEVLEAGRQVIAQREEENKKAAKAKEKAAEKSGGSGGRPPEEGELSEP